MLQQADVVTFHQRYPANRFGIGFVLADQICEQVPDPIVGKEPPKLPDQIVDRGLLVSRLRTGQVEVLGVHIRCQCTVGKKDVKHILLQCSITAGVRSEAKKALGVKQLTIIELLWKDRGYEWAEKIWQRFLEAKCD